MPFKKDYIPWNKNKTGIYSDEYKKKISIGTKKGMKKMSSKEKESWRKKLRIAKKDTIPPHGVGEKCPRWKGGISSKYKRDNAPRQVSEFCEICGAFGNSFKRGLHFDHDHNTGKFRGWICVRCNLALGMVKDNVGILQKMIIYINKDV